MAYGRSIPTHVYHSLTRHLTTVKVGDGLIDLSGEAKQLVLDFSLLILYLERAEPMGH